MQVKVNHELEQFQTKALEITIESQEELDFFNALFEWAPVWTVMRDYAKAGASQINSALTRSGGVNHTHAAIIRELLQDVVEK